MKCPVDQVDLVMSERQGVEIDYCPTCRGIWLDRGELDKILDRAATMPAPAAPVAPAPVAPAPAPAAPPRYDDRRYEDKRYDDKRYPDPRYGDPRYDSRQDPRYDPRKKKKESWLGELFDF